MTVLKFIFIFLLTQNKKQKNDTISPYNFPFKLIKPNRIINKVIFLFLKVKSEK